MFQEINLVLFLTASLVVIVAPGPDNILVLTRGISQGRKAAMVSAAGASVGLVCHSLFAAAGLSALLAQSALAFAVVKYAGAAYLIYLGTKTLLSRQGFAVSGSERPIRLGSVFGQGVASNVMNPKIAVFFLLTSPSSPSRPLGAWLRNCSFSPSPSHCLPGSSSTYWATSPGRWATNSLAARASQMPCAGSREAYL